jgi:hypothetical protein
MDKRLRTDIGFTLMFLLMLIVGIGAFFYGVKIGTERTLASLPSAQGAAEEDSPSTLTSYQQQDLVSFYHTVFLPYREFQNQWFSTVDKWAGNPSADLAASLKELIKQANAKYTAIQGAYVSPASPLLTSAQTDFLRSLKLLSESFSSLAKDAEKLTPDQLTSELENDAFFRDGQAYALSAQNSYFSAMLKWGATVSTEIPGDFKIQGDMELSQWQTLPIMVKNKIAADYLSANSMFTSFLPHDLTARIDDFIRSGQAERMQQKTVLSVADLLTGTNAVRNGDFLRAKAKLYPNELLPLLPFFTPEN